MACLCVQQVNYVLSLDLIPFKCIRTKRKYLRARLTVKTGNFMLNEHLNKHFREGEHGRLVFTEIFYLLIR